MRETACLRVDDMFTKHKSRRSAYLTQNRWDEAKAVGQHGTLNDVKFWEYFEGQKTQSDDVQRFKEKNESEFFPREVFDGLEEAKPYSPQPRTKFRRREGENNRPLPCNYLFSRNQRFKLFLQY